METPKNLEQISERREEFKRVNKEILAQIYKDYTPEDRDDYELAQAEVYSEDEDRALASLDVFGEPNNLWDMEEVITHARNVVVKLESAKRLNPVSNITLLYESYKRDVQKKSSENYKKIKLNDLQYQITASREALKNMVDKSDGEAKKLLEEKLNKFEETVQSFELS